MHVVLCDRGSDQENQIDGLTVQSVVIDTVLDDHGCKTGFDDRVAFAVGDGDTFADAGGGLFFSVVDLGAVGFQIADLFTLCHEGDHLVQRFLFFLRGTVQINTPSVEQISNTHVIPPFTRIAVCKFDIPTVHSRGMIELSAMSPFML